jgi:hypothetical protein
VVGAVTCSYPGITAVFGQTASASDASAFLARLFRRRAGASEAAWGDGVAVAYGSATNPSLAWDYTGEPYIAVAVSTDRAALQAWWTSTGRVVRAGA